jgi:hypothetical protein
VFGAIIGGQRTSKSESARIGPAAVPSLSRLFSCQRTSVLPMHCRARLVHSPRAQCREHLAARLLADAPMGWRFCCGIPGSLFHCVKLAERWRRSWLVGSASLRQWRSRRGSLAHDARDGARGEARARLGGESRRGPHDPAFDARSPKQDLKVTLGAQPLLVLIFAEYRRSPLITASVLIRPNAILVVLAFALPSGETSKRSHRVA